MWFLNPGIAIPTFWPGEDPKPNDGMPVFNDDGNEVVMADAETRRSVEAVDLSAVKTARKSYTTFQNKGSSIKLPHTRFAVSTSRAPVVEGAVEVEATKARKKRRKVSDVSGLESGRFEDLLLEQASEMRRLMRRSVTLHEMKALGLDGEATDAEERITLIELDEQADDPDAAWAAEFFQDVL